MSLNKLGIMVFSGLMALAMAPVAPAQSAGQYPAQKQTQDSTDQTAKSRTSNKSEEKSSQPASKQRSSKQDVRQIQTALKSQGFDPGPVDGVMGVMTMTALRNYQSHNQLEVTGTINSETQSALMSGAAAGQRSQPGLNQGQTPSSLGRSTDFGAAPTPDQNQVDQNQPKDSIHNQSSVTERNQEAVPEGLARSTDTVSDLGDVRQVQQALRDLEYAPGEQNGMMSEQTRQAIREFQWLNSLPVTGNLDEQTRSEIMSQGQGGAHDSLNKSNDSNRGLQKPDASINDQQLQKPEALPTEESEQKDIHHPNGPAAEQSSTQRDRDTKANSSSSESLKPNKDAAERVSKSAAVLHDLTGTADKKVPNELLERAEAIAVIPNVIKGAFGIGGRYGKGVVAQRSDSGRWSAPSFIEIGGGSFGAQIGVTSTDLVLVFTDRKALSLLDGGKDLKLGVDAGVAAGPVGRSAEAGVNLNLDTAIYAYSRSKGLFAGIALDGAVLSIDKDMNEKVYGASRDAEQILSGSVSANTTVRPFLDALDPAVPKKRMSQR